ncbi:MAG TPA: hypothetical protein VMT12_05745 [Syntrophales bacterium]|nr:hypothetical protein [Syntrophales bacterium]
MTGYIDNLLSNADLDLSQSVIMKDDPSQFIVRPRIGPPGIISLLFGLPCLVLIIYSLRLKSILLLLPVIFCPPLEGVWLLCGRG